MIQIFKDSQIIFSDQPELVAYVEEIITEGKLAGIPIPKQLPGRWKYTDEIKNRIFIAELFIKNPQLARKIIARKCVGGHGTQSGALLDVLTHGLRPRKYLKEKGVHVISGEGMYGGAYLNQEYLSLSQWTDDKTICNYATRGSGHRSIKDIEQQIKELKQEKERFPDNSLAQSIDIKIEDLENIITRLIAQPETDEERLTQYLLRDNFPLIFMNSVPDELNQPNNRNAKKLIIPDSQIESEFCLENGIGIEHVQIILVPKDKTDKVKMLIDTYVGKDNKIAILPIESYQDISIHTSEGTFDRKALFSSHVDEDGSITNRPIKPHNGESTLKGEPGGTRTPDR